MLLAESIACSDKLKSFFLLFFTSVYSQKISLSRSRITLSPPLCAPRSNLTNFVIDALERCAPSKQIILHSPERLGFDGSRAIDSSVLPVPLSSPPRVPEATFFVTMCAAKPLSVKLGFRGCA